MKFTLPVGVPADVETAAVNVTELWLSDGLALDWTVIVVGTGLTTSVAEPVPV
jgi:hypothetical protein